MRGRGIKVMQNMDYMNKGYKIYDIWRTGIKYIFLGFG